MLRGAHLEDLHLVHRRIGVVQHIVDGARQGVQVLAIDGGDEGAVQLVDQDAADLIGFLLALRDLLGQLRLVAVHIGG